MSFPPDVMCAWYLEEKAAKDRLARESKAAQQAALATSAPSSTTSTRPSTPATANTTSMALNHNQLAVSGQPITAGLFGSIYQSLSRVATIDKEKQMEVVYGFKSASSTPTEEKSQAEAFKIAMRKRDLDIVCLPFLTKASTKY